MILRQTSSANGSCGSEKEWTQNVHNILKRAGATLDGLAKKDEV
jgi:hypothetical protein